MLPSGIGAFRSLDHGTRAGHRFAQHRDKLGVSRWMFNVVAARLSRIGGTWRRVRRDLLQWKMGNHGEGSRVIACKQPVLLRISNQCHCEERSGPRNYTDGIAHLAMTLMELRTPRNDR